MSRSGIQTAHFISNAGSVQPCARQINHSKPPFVCLFVFLFVYMWRDQTSQFHPVRRVGSGFPWFCLDAAFMWKQSLGPFSPSVVTEDNEIHNICHLLALFGVTDLLLIHGLPTRVQLRSWNEADGSHGLSGAAADQPKAGMCPALPLLRTETQRHIAFDHCNHYHHFLIIKTL